MTNSEEPSAPDGISSMKVADFEQHDHLHDTSNNFGNYVNGDLKESLENGTGTGNSNGNGIALALAPPALTLTSQGIDSGPGPAYVSTSTTPATLPNCDPVPEKETSVHQLSNSNSSSIEVQVQALTQPLLLPFSLICGEELEHKTQVSDGNLVLTNYRLFLQTKDATYNLPLGLIESVECRDIFFLHLNCKDARCIRCTFPNNEATLEMLKRIQTAISPTKKIDDGFAFAFYKRTTRENVSEDVRGHLGLDLGEFPTPKERFDAEIKRMEFNVQGPWRVSDENKDYELCSSYPTHIIVPCVMDKKKLEKVAGFRSSRRFPAIVWRHKGNGAVISRCSQPEVGWFGWRSNEDEELVQNIVLACADNNGRMIGDSQSKLEPKTRNFSGDSCDSTSTDGTSPPIGAYDSLSSLEVVPEPPQNIKKLLILDARSYSTAVVNRARGGGCECLEYYTNCEIQFMNLANIHSIRKSFMNVRQLCSLPSDQANNNWFSQLESCKWLQHMSGLMKAAVTVATAIESEGRPVMVHCSDGWDRTPQIVALAEILLDPYYRSLEGFQVLVEREWLDFGHKFADRCGQGIGSDDTNERCPVFLQWLDCLHQLIKQFPTAFEFNLTFLVKLAQHTYSNLFGTFLCNTTKERHAFKIPKLTHSIWRFLRAPTNYEKFRNNLYSSCDKVLWPCCEVRKLKLWTQVYLGYDNPRPVLTEVINPSQDSSPAPSVAAECESSERISNYRSLEKSKARSSSCENLHMSPSGELQRRQSHPNLCESFLGGLDSEETEAEAESEDRDRLPQTEKMLTAASKDIDYAETETEAELTANENEESSAYKIKKDLKDCSLLVDGEDNSENENDDTETNSEEKSDATVINIKLLKSIESSTDTLVAEVYTVAETTSTFHGHGQNHNHHETQILSEVNNKTEDLESRNRNANEISRKTESENRSRGLNREESVNGDLRDLRPTDRDREQYDVTATTDKCLSDLTQTVSDLDLLGGAGNQHCEVCATSIKLLHGESFTTTSTTASTTSSGISINGSLTMTNGHGAQGQSSSLSSSSGSGTSGGGGSGSKFSSCNTPRHSRTPSNGATPEESSYQNGQGQNQTVKNGYQTQDKWSGESSQSQSSSTSATASASTTTAIANTSTNNSKSSYDVDGLQPLHDEVQSRLNVIISGYRGQIDRLSTELQMYRNTLMRQLGHKCHQQKVELQDDAVSVADSLCENHSVGHDSHSSEISWEAVDEKDTRPQLWLPDYAVNRCMGCDATFWLGKRKHHCRACGKVFCDECSEYRITIPSEQFFDPVRVCSNCYNRQLNSQGISRIPLMNGNHNHQQETMRPNGPNCSSSSSNGLHHSYQGSPPEAGSASFSASPKTRIFNGKSEELPRAHHHQHQPSQHSNFSNFSNSSSTNTNTSKPAPEVSVSTSTSNGVKAKSLSSKNILNGVYPNVHNFNGDSVSTNGHSCHQ